jgi:hypothetical protein
MKVRIFLLTNGGFIVGQYDEGKNILIDSLQLIFKGVMDKKTGAQGQYPLCIPIGYPLNRKEIGLNLKDISYITEITDFEELYQEVYEEDLQKLKNPNMVIQPKSTIIY